MPPLAAGGSRPYSPAAAAAAGAAGAAAAGAAAADAAAAAAARRGGEDRTPVVVAWSGGKDSALALHRLLLALPGEAGYRPIGLLTTFTEPGDRVAAHRVRRELVEAQAAAAGLPLHGVEVPMNPSNEIYEQRLGAALAPLRAQGLRHVAFGDLFLADLRAYRERHLASLGMQALFPLWSEDTALLARRFLALGFAANLVAVDTGVLSARLAGCSYDAAFLDALPAGVDPCGENGEFHTFVHAGPLFDCALPVGVGALDVQGRFAYRDLQPLPTRE